MKILLAEDNSDFQSMIRGFLLRRYPGAEVITVSNGRSAAQELRRAKFDLLLTDLHMPGGNGDDLIYKIRFGEISNAPEVVHVPIILISTAPEDEVLPVDAVLGETMEMEELARLIDHIMN